MNNNITLTRLIATAEQHTYTDINKLRGLIARSLLSDLESYTKIYNECRRLIKNNTGWERRIKKFLCLEILDISRIYTYHLIVRDLVTMYQDRQSVLMSDEFIKTICDKCPLCHESLVGQPIIIPDCLHAVCVGCFIRSCRGYANYQCPRTCHIIKQIYPVVNKIPIEIPVQQIKESSIQCDYV